MLRKSNNTVIKLTNSSSRNNADTNEADAGTAAAAAFVVIAESRIYQFICFFHLLKIL